MDVSFVLNLKNGVSSGLAKILSDSHSVFGGIDKNIANTQSGLNALAKPVTLTVDTSEIETANKALDVLSGKFRNLHSGGGGGIGGGGGMGIMGGMVKANLITAGIERTAQYANEAIRSSLEKGMDVEQSIIGLATFVG